MKKSVIFGTAGHIDHGKSSLVKALTGKDPDRLAEEKEKGISIELGYASLESDDLLISFIDVPGHEKLIKTMISGSLGFDAVLFCVDGREGVMPQTEEHFNILTAIGIRSAVIAVTKADICSPEQISDTENAVRELFKNSRIKLEAVVPVSVSQPDTIEKLKSEIFRTAQTVTPKTQSRCYVLRADRVFSLKGHGTVVTGTSLFGKITAGDMIYNINTGGKARIKSIQVHDKQSDKSIAGQRTAMNLPDFSTDDVRKGNILSENPKLTDTMGIYASVTSFGGLSASELIRHNKTYPIIIGSDIFEGKIIFANVKTLQSAESDICFIKLDRKAVVFYEEPFIIRSFSPQKSVAGGRVLGLEQTYPDRKRSFPIIEHLSRTEYPEAFRAMTDIYPCGLSIPEPIQFSGLLRNELTLKLAQLQIVNSYGFLIDNKRIENFVEETIARLKEKGSLKLNTLAHECMNITEQLKVDITNRIVESAQKMGFIFDGHMLKHRQKDPFEEDAMIILNLMKQDPGLSNAALLAERSGMTEDKTGKCLQFLANRSFIRRVEGSTHITLELINSFIDTAYTEAKKTDGIDLAHMKQFYDLPRKLMVPLMEQLDKTGLFINKNNKRQLKRI